MDYDHLTVDRLYRQLREEKNEQIVPLVMNFADPKGGLSVRDVETTIGAGVDVVLPRSSAVPASTNRGTPLLESGSRRDPMVKELKRLVSRFSATPLMRATRYGAKHRAAS